ncbi:hypothetical protein JW868_02575 [Candidatus Woesearchaeota archaeon]|nr:hypothetical protein [Candidatus Woesearchaeota archaeon]
MGKVIELNPIRQASVAIWWYLPSQEQLEYLAGRLLEDLSNLHLELEVRETRRGQFYEDPELNDPSILLFSQSRHYTSGQVDISDKCAIAIQGGRPGDLRPESPEERCGRLVTSLNAIHGTIPESYFKRLQDLYKTIKGENPTVFRSSQVKSKD